MDLIVVIVNWNTRDLLLECLRAVLSTVRNPSYQVVVVDNASTDGSASMVRAEFPDVDLVASTENLGFAGGNNLALREARGRFVLLLNPDATVQKGAIDLLYQAMEEHPNLGALGAQLLNVDGSDQESWGHFPSLLTEIPGAGRWRRASRARHFGDSTGVSAGSYVDWANGACLMLRRAALDQVGLLDESYWLYTEETDWCRRARSLGWYIGVLPGARVVHVRRAASRQAPSHTLVHYHKSRVLFIRKHSGMVPSLLARAIVASKAIAWSVFPTRSPLMSAMPDIARSDVRGAYADLLSWAVGGSGG